MKEIPITLTEFLKESKIDPEKWLVLSSTKIIFRGQIIKFCVETCGKNG